MTNKLRLPNNWDPRYYQMNLWHYLQDGGKRAYEVAHRRWGKDDVCLHWTARSAMQKVATYWHMLPEANQARKAIWDAINPHTGKRRIDEAFPLVMRKRTVDNEMKIEFINGSMWQVVGSDNFNSLMGSPPYGIVFSEWALANPLAWAYLMPVLEENGGWAFFITTPRGRNHGYSFYEMAKKTPGWFAEIQTANDTNVFTQEQLMNILKELIAAYGHDEGKARFEQEYFCSFSAAIPGAYYGSDMDRAEREERISGVPHKPGNPVFPCFDFGIGQSNATAVTFVQVIGREPRAIDYFESNSSKIEDLGKMLKEKDYLYGKLMLPHDAAHDRLSTGMSYQAQFEQMGFDVQIIPRTPDLLGDINITRQVMGMFWFDERKCARLIDALRSYHRDWDEANKTFKRAPKHDWSSHGADSFRAACVAYNMGLFERDTPYYEDEADEMAYDDDKGSLTGY